MRKSAKQQVEEIEMARFEIYMTFELLERGILLSKQISYIERIKREKLWQQEVEQQLRTKTEQ